MEVAGIYTQFNRSLLNFIKSKIKSKEDAEDILQNVFIKISMNVNKLIDEQKLQGWIYSITRNAIIDYYRVNANKKNIALDELLQETLPQQETTDSTKGLDQCLGSMINLLPEDYRTIVVDSEIKGIAQKELAEKYSMPYSSVRSRVQRGRERLKQLFYNCCHIETDSLGNVLEAEGKNNCGSSCDPCAK